MTSEPEGGGNGMFSLSQIAGGSHAPAEVLNLANMLGKANDCPVKVTSEASGYHIYIPCPECLKSHKKAEIQDPKYAINASMYLGLGKYRIERAGSPHLYESIDDALERRSSTCMRTKSSKHPHQYRVTDLQRMGTVLERHPEIMRSKFKLIGGGASDDARAHWEQDPISGAHCPPPPGQVIPLTQLGDPFHPAIEYLTQRNYDIAKLEKQFRCGFCVKEYPHKTNGVFYVPLPGGWRDTPQHRIVFASLIDGVPMTWQARVIDKISPDGLSKLMLHPYKVPFQWDVVAIRATPSSNWIPLSPFDEVNEDGIEKFKPSKYRTAKWSSRELMGWDAACERADRDPSNMKWIVLCEGPLDAARVGPGGVAVIGSSLNHDNLNRIASRFHIVFTAFDTDRAGTLATEKIGRMFYSDQLRNSVVKLVVPLRVQGGKDIGDMGQHEVDLLLANAIKAVGRQF
jgi:hypothetical protein